VKNALEPFWEARFAGSSYGFRPGRGGQDAIEQIFGLALPQTTRPWVLDADIAGAFHNMGHAALGRTMGKFPARELLKQWLKAGDVAEEMRHPTATGVPQGGGISPLLFNVALHGMEQALGISSTPRGVTRGTSAVVRYADDCAVFCPTQEQAIDARALLGPWREARGLKWSDEKTRMRPRREGCSFLGGTIRQSPAPNSARSGYKRLITPRTDSVKQLQRKLKGLWRKHVGTPTGALSNARNPVIRGWSPSFRTGVAKATFSALANCMYYRAQRDMTRRHPTTSGRGRTQKYQGRSVGHQDQWAFQDTGRNATLRNFAWTQIVRHRLVRSTSSPADPTLQDSWRQRRAQPPMPTRRGRQLAQRQHGQCPVCHHHLENGEELHVHPGVPKKHGGTDDLVKLRLVHHTCPRQIHRSSAPLGVRRVLEPCTR
jgi:RNA-directed DNA polymerase